MANVVEAILRSKYEDGIEAGVENTRKLMENTFSAMKDGGAAAAAGIAAAFESTVGALESWRAQLSKAADESDSSFKKMSLGAAAFGLAAVEIFLRASKAAGEFIAETIKEASEYFQVKQSFDALNASAGAQAVSLARLRVATEGQVTASALMSNATRILSADLPLTGEQYSKLVENVARLAKGTGSDAVAAQDALTTALIRGNSRGLGPALGLHLAVKDAVSSMAAEMDVNASKVTDAARLTAFYNEVQQKTEEAIKRLPPSYLTLEEVINSAKTAQKDLTDELGAAALKSGVLQELLARLQGALLGVSVSAGAQNNIALRTNEIIISLLRGFADFVDVLNVVYIVGKAVGDTFVFLTDVVFAACMFAVTGIIALMYPLAEGLARIPVIGKYFRGAADDMKFALDFSAKATEEFGRGALHAFDGVTSGFGGAADGARKLAAEMEKLRGSTVKGADANSKHAESSRSATEAAKELQKQLEQLRNTQFQLSQSVATPEQRDLEEAAKQGAEITRLDKLSTEQRTAAIEQVWAVFHAKQQARRDEDQAKADQAEQQQLQKVKQFEDQLLSAQASGYDKAEEQLRQHLNKIYELTSTADGDTVRLEILARGEYIAAIDKLNAEELQKEVQAAQQREKARQQEQQREINDAIAAANTMYQVAERVDQGKLSRTFLPDPAYVQQVIAKIKAQLAVLYAQPIVNDKQIQEITKLQEALEKLNRLNMSPFQKTLQQLKDNLQQMSQQAIQAWSQMWADMTSGQEDAGKKFLAGLLNIIAQQLEMMAVKQVAEAIASAAELDFAGAARHAAAAAALGALGGVLQGFASALSSSSSSSAAQTSAAAAPTTGSAPTNSNPATISVGSSGGPQNAGSVQQTQHIIQLEIKPTDAFVVNAVTKDVNANGQIRTVIKKTANG